MGWASDYIHKLQQGETVQCSPRGNSMRGKIESGQLVTIEPVQHLSEPLHAGDIVLCKVRGRQYLHLTVRSLILPEKRRISRRNLYFSLVYQNDTERATETTGKSDST